MATSTKSHDPLSPEALSQVSHRVYINMCIVLTSNIFFLSIFYQRSVKERKALLDALQKSLEDTQQANDEAIEELLNEAKESAEELWTTYRNDMQEMCALYIMKSEQLVEKNGLSEDDGFRLQGEVDAFFLVENDEYPVKSNDNNVSSSSYSLKPKKGRGRPKGSKNIVSSSMGLPKKSRGRPKGSKNKVTTMSAKTSEVQDVSIVSVHNDEDEDISCKFLLYAAWQEHLLLFFLLKRVVLL